MLEYLMSGSLGSLISESEEQPVAGYTMGRRREKRRSRIFSQMFSSDVEEDTKSDVLPSLPSYNVRYHSMVRL